MKNLAYFIVMFSATTLLFSGCKKNVDPAQPALERGLLYLHLHTYVGSTEVDLYNTIYTTESERKISLSISQFYMSKIELIKLDGSIVSIPDTIILKIQNETRYALGNAPVGNYKSIRFNVGLDQKTNASIPPGGSVLDRTEMWFGSSAQPDGFIFLNIQGKIDTTSDASGADDQMQSFVYKIGTNANLKQVTMPNQNFVIAPNQTKYLHMYYEVNKLFTGIPLGRSENLSIKTPAENETPLASKIKDNIPTMFRYEQE